MLDRLSGLLPSRVRRLLPAPLRPRYPTIEGTVAQVPDDLPPTAFAVPVRVDRLAGSWDPAHQRAEFRVVVRDAEGKRCPNLAVEARVTGPSRSATAEITTDLMGAAVFRMADGPGDYEVEVLDLGARGIDWDPAGGVGVRAAVRSADDEA